MIWPPSLAGMSLPHLVKPIPTYAQPSPQLASGAPVLAYPTPPLAASPAVAGHGYFPGLSASGQTERVVSPTPHLLASPALGGRDFASSGSNQGDVTATCLAILPGGQEVVAEADPSATLAELEGKLSVGIDFGSVIATAAQSILMTSVLTRARCLRFLLTVMETARPSRVLLTAQVATWAEQSGRSSTGLQRMRHTAKCRQQLCTIKRVRQKRL